jgi:hypothetical protein
VSESEDAVAITHAEALRLIDEQVGERIYLALSLARTESESGEEGPIRFIQKIGRLGNPFQDRPPRLEDDIGYYGFGRDGIDAFPIPPLTGTTQLRDDGIDFLISETASIRIAWRGSEEIGDGPDAGHLGRLRILGLAREEEVRVLPEDEAAFEATAEVAWPLSATIEQRLERGEFLTGAPAETQVLDVAFDQGNREQVMALAPESDGDPPTLRFRGMIVGRSLDSADDDAPS